MTLRGPLSRSSVDGKGEEKSGGEVGRGVPWSVSMYERLEVGCLIFIVSSVWGTGSTGRVTLSYGSFSFWVHVGSLFPPKQPRTLRS